MAKRQRKGGGKAAAKKAKRKIEQYEHNDKTRMNNPPVGLVTPQTESPDSPKKSYAYDPHIDPSLQWAGKAERLSFDLPTVSLHVHERIDPCTIIEAVRRRNGGGQNGGQLPLFETADENPPLRDAIDFYRHPHNWTNRLIAGDSLLVMNSLLEKEGMAGKVQMAYIDPPYGIKYKSNFQPFVNKRDIADSDKDEDLTQEPEMLEAFRDTWEVGIHSYLTYLRDRLLLARDLLHETGSCFVQISGENLHFIRNLMDEVFGERNFIGLISFQKKGSQSGDFIPPIHEYLAWYGKDRASTTFNRLYVKRELSGVGGSGFDYCELADGSERKLLEEEKQGVVELPPGAKAFRYNPLFSAKNGPNDPIEIGGIKYPSGGNSWKVSSASIPKLHAIGRVVAQKTRLVFKRYADDFEYVPITNIWSGFGGAPDKIYVVQTHPGIVARCLLMTTVPGDLVLDPTCGSGTTAVVAEQWGRRWITCDTSRVSITLAKQRVMSQTFNYYKLAMPALGVTGGFIYATAPHITLKSIANNPEIQSGMSQKAVKVAIGKYAEPEKLYDNPEVDSSKARVTGPFTLEAVPAPSVRPIGQTEEPQAADQSIARSGLTIRARDWRDELLKTGVRGRRGERIEFTRVEPLPGTRWLHADAETKESTPKRVVISFGPDHAPLEQKQVELAWEESRTLNPKPAMILFAAFQFDPEAAKDIDEMKPEKAGMVFLKVQMNTDLLTEDLKKKRASNESFWLVGQPDAEVRRIAKGEDKGKYQVQVNGFDYYNPRTGTVESGDTSKIAMWMLDTDYDGRSLYPRQVFFPMAGDKEGWAKLAKNLKAEIDEERIEAYRGTISLPFEAGDNRRIGVKIIDDRGIESLKIVGLV
jgi:adenine-specific DNA-methyltransferase